MYLAIVELTHIQVGIYGSGYYYHNIGENQVSEKYSQKTSNLSDCFYRRKSKIVHMLKNVGDNWEEIKRLMPNQEKSDTLELW